MSIDEEYKTILDSGEFDENYYKKTYNIPDNINPIYHYLEIGTQKNFNPSPNFDTHFYLEEYFDVKNANVNPFFHYIKWGKKEKRLPKLMELDEIKKEYENKKLSLPGKDNYLFLINDSNSEILQHFDSKFENTLDFVNFSEDTEFKESIFKKYGIKYAYFIVPDKSIVCKNLLPFQYHQIRRIINNLPVIDFSNDLNENHYFKHDTHMNFKGGKLFASKIINYLDEEIDAEKFEELIKYNKIKLEKHYNDLVSEINFSGTDEEKKNYETSEEIFIETPITLKECDIPKEFEYFNKRKSFYYKNEKSASDLRVLIFHDSTIESMKNFLTFYFREIFLFWDYGYLNEELIKWFNPDMILEIRVERFIENISKPIWVKDKIDFLENHELKNPPLTIKKNKESKYKISVIIPIYNGEKYLNKCLNSIINQTLQEIEIICVNDGSTDNSLNILKDYALKDKRLKIISTENKGQGSARNIGLEESNGEYIAFIDADDWIEEYALELLYNQAKSSNLDLLFFQMVNYIQNSNNFVSTELYNHKCFEDNGITENMIFNYENTLNCLFEIPVGPVSKIYRKEFLESNNLKFPENMIFEDNIFFYNTYFKSKRNGFLKKQLYFRRRHDESVTQTFDKHIFDIIKAVNGILEVFNENNTYEIHKRDVINHTFSMLIEWLKKSPLSLKESFFNEIKNEFIGFYEYKKDFKKYLNKNNRLTYELFLENNDYLKFNSKYKLNNSEYLIFDGSHYILPHSKEYEKYIQEQINKKYKVSIVIPIYNNGYLTHRTIMSIENQTFDFKNIEVLLINDNSKDETFEIINKYSNKFENIKSIHLNESSGSSGNPRNIGLLESSGEYIMFLDHDDFFEIDGIKKLYDEIELTKADVVFGTYTEIKSGKLYPIRYSKEKRGYFENISENERLIAIPAPSIWTKLFKREFLIEHDILFPTILGEDAIFMSEVFLNAKGIHYLWNTTICYHDLRDSSTTNNVTLNYLEELFTSEIYMCNYYRKRNKEEYIKIRGIGIINFAIEKLYQSDLDYNEMKSIFDLVKEFLTIHKNIGSEPNFTNQKTKIISDIILYKTPEELIIHLKELKINERNKKEINNINNLKNNLNSLKKKNDELNSTNNLLITKNKNLENENKNLENENKNLLHENNYLTKFQNDVLDSKSWKMTKPLRNIKTNLSNDMNNEPLISIIIPIYNKSKFIEPTIKSIFRQTYGNIEIICIEDCSTDNSLEILKKLSKRYSKLKIIKNKVTLGHGKCKNKGIEKSKGKYLLFINITDIILDINSFKTFINEAEKYNANMVSANLIYINSNNSIIKEKKYLKPITRINTKNPFEYGIPLYLTKNLFNTEFIKKNNILFPDSNYCENIVFLSEILKEIDFYVEIPNEYYGYKSSERMKIDTFEKLYEYLKNTKEVYKKFSDTPEFENLLKNISNQLINILNIDKFVKTIEEYEKIKDVLNDLINYTKTNEEVFKMINPPIQKYLQETKQKII